MANVVEFLVKIRDLASGQMRAFAGNTDNAMSRINSRINRTSQSVNQLNSRLDDLRRTRDMSLDTRQIARANREMERLEQRRDRLENRGRSGSGGMLATGLVMGGLALAGAGLVTSLKAGMERQMAATSFDVMAGQKDGKKLHSNLMGFATDTIYGNEVFGEAKTMLGFGVAAKNIMPSLRMLGDVAMGDAEHMKALSLAFAQTAAAGKLTGSDLLQYINAGFNPLQAISAKTGRSMSKLKQDVSDSKITFKDVAGAFEYATGPLGRFHNGMKKMGETPTGKWQAFTGALQTFAGTVGTGLLPVLGGVATLLTGLMNDEPMMYGIAAGIGAMAAAWGLYTIYTKRAVIWQGILNVMAAWPLVLVGALAGGITYLCLKYESWGKSAVAVWNIGKAVISDLKAGFTDFAQTISWAFEMSLLKVKNVFQTAGGLLNNLKSAWGHVKKGEFAEAGKALTASFTTDAEKKITALNAKHDKDRLNNRAAIDANGKIIQSQAKLIHFDVKGGKNLKKEAADWLQSKFDFGAGGGKNGGAPDGVADTAKGIAGGGVRNVTINIGKLGPDQITLHTTNLNESTAELEQIFINLFRQVVNSGGSMMPA